VAALEAIASYYGPDELSDPMEFTLKELERKWARAIGGYWRRKAHGPRTRKARTNPERSGAKKAGRPAAGKPRKRVDIEIKRTGARGPRVIVHGKRSARTVRSVLSYFGYTPHPAAWSDGVRTPTGGMIYPISRVVRPRKPRKPARANPVYPRYPSLKGAMPAMLDSDDGMTAIGRVVGTHRRPDGALVYSVEITRNFHGSPAGDARYEVVHHADGALDLSDIPAVLTVARETARRTVLRYRGHYSGLSVLRTPAMKKRAVKSGARPARFEDEPLVRQILAGTRRTHRTNPVRGRARKTSATITNRVPRAGRSTRKAR